MLTYLLWALHYACYLVQVQDGPCLPSCGSQLHEGKMETGCLFNFATWKWKWRNYERNGQWKKDDWHSVVLRELYLRCWPVLKCSVTVCCHCPLCHSFDSKGILFIETITDIILWNICYTKFIVLMKKIGALRWNNLTYNLVLIGNAWAFIQGLLSIDWMAYFNN